MLNEVLWFGLLLVNFLGVIFFYRFFGKAGLFTWIGIAVILANIQVMKTVQLFGFVAALGDIIYATTYLVTDILNENYGRKEANRAVMIGFAVMLMTTITMQVTLMMIPDESDFINPHLKEIFSFFPRIAFASMTAYLISQFHDVWSFHAWRKLTRGKYLWLRNNASTMISQLIDNTIFTLIAFVGFFGLFGWEQVFEWSIILQIFFVSLLMKYFIAIADTPFMYWAKRMKDRVRD